MESPEHRLLHPPVSRTSCVARPWATAFSHRQLRADEIRRALGEVANDYEAVWEADVDLAHARLEAEQLRARIAANEDRYDDLLHAAVVEDDLYAKYALAELTARIDCDRLLLEVQERHIEECDEDVDIAVSYR